MKALFMLNAYVKTPDGECSYTLINTSLEGFELNEAGTHYEEIAKDGTVFSIKKDYLDEKLGIGA